MLSACVGEEAPSAWWGSSSGETPSAETSDEAIYEQQASQCHSTGFKYVNNYNGQFHPYNFYKGWHYQTFTANTGGKLAVNIKVQAYVMNYYTAWANSSGNTSRLRVEAKAPGTNQWILVGEKTATGYRQNQWLTVERELTGGSADGQWQVRVQNVGNNLMYIRRFQTFLDCDTACFDPAPTAEQTGVCNEFCDIVWGECSLTDTKTDCLDVCFKKIKDSDGQCTNLYDFGAKYSELGSYWWFGGFYGCDEYLDAQVPTSHLQAHYNQCQTRLQQCGHSIDE